MNATNILAIIILITSIGLLIGSQFIDHKCNFNDSYKICLETSPTYFWFNFIGSLGIILFSIIKFIQWDTTFTTLSKLIKQRKL